MKVYSIIKSPIMDEDKDILLFETESERDNHLNKMIKDLEESGKYTVRLHNEIYYDVDTLDLKEHFRSPRSRYTLYKHDFNLWEDK